MRGLFFLSLRKRSTLSIMYTNTAMQMPYTRNLPADCENAPMVKSIILAPNIEAEPRNSHIMPNAVESRFNHGVLLGECLCPAEYYAVYDYECKEAAQTVVKVWYKFFKHHTCERNQRGNNNYIRGYAHFIGDYLAQSRDEHIAQRKDNNNGEPHSRRTRSGRNQSESGAGAQNEHKGGVLENKPVKGYLCILIHTSAPPSN